MGEINWTDEQESAITKKDSNILVAAAAGSGKTAVLVERIIRKIINDNVDIDKMLVVTFTSAAASEMREKILNAIYKKIDQNPNDLKMQKQVNLLSKASICTIDSFCLDVIRNNFFEINISANARVADTTEINLLKQESLDEIFEEKYMNNDSEFLEMIEKYTKYNKDEDLKEQILEIYNYMQTTPFPDEWLNQKIKMLQLEAQKENFSESIWGKTIVEYAKEILNNCIKIDEIIIKKIEKNPDLNKSAIVISEDLSNYKVLLSKLKNWDDAIEFMKNMQFTKWPQGKKSELKQYAKNVRDNAKKEYKKITEIITCSSKKAYDDLLYMHHILTNIQNIINEFSKKFTEKKTEKNIIDFNDIEHLALKILVKKDKNGNIQRTNVAQKYSEKFEEIAIDEYQDSNDIQELILNSVSKNNNIFMVGDVKQSIYKFRQACPELFLEKYNTYKMNPKVGENRKIQLFKNFRSRENILNITNAIFENIMSKELGKIEYNKEEYLNLGAQYSKACQNLKTELNIINLKEEENIWKTEDTNNEESENTENIENVVLEARFIANKIKELIENKYQVYDRNIEGEYRDIKYRDIAVLLRSANIVAPIYEKEIAELGIDVYTDSSNGYFESTEITTIMAVLKIISNPMQDIPLVTVMKSIIGNFTDNELIEISFEDSKLSFYNKLKLYCEQENNNLKNGKRNEKLVKKINNFLELIEKWRQEEKYKPLNELIWQIYIDTGYLNYVSLLPNGKLKTENLKLLFEKAKQYESASFKGLYNFICFIDKMKQSSGDTGSAKIIGEGENVVRIMSIHKSKGLEFPVVFLAETGKKFNFMGINKKILLHKDLGLGPQYINETKHVEFKTLAKKAVAMQIKNEMIAEEMRILYVALTRAKEKLIISGIQKNYVTAIKGKKEDLEMCVDNDVIPPLTIRKYNSYLDWIQLVYLKNSTLFKDILDVNIVNREKIIKQSQNTEQENFIEKLNKNIANYSNPVLEKNIKKKLNWKYDFKDLENIPTKSSVTKIKELMIKREEPKVNLSKIETGYEKELECPKFMKGENLTGAQKGTIMHLCLKEMNEKKEYDKNSIDELINNLIIKDLITQKEADSINKEKLLEYTKSDLWKELKDAKEIHREQPFYINTSVNSIYEMSDESENANILVQGIIDLFYINQKDELVLVDYKTDYIKNGQEEKLIKEYKQQLSLYKKAIEESMDRKVDKIQIYSIYLNKTINVEC